MRFKEVFFALLLLSFVSAFFLPAGITNPARNVQALFYPVARPARAIGSAFNDRFSPPPAHDRAVADVKAENEQLRLMLSQLTAELHQLQQVNADRQLVGDLRQYCTPVRVVGNDPGRRQSLGLRAGTVQGVHPGMAVLSRKGLVGRIERSGPGGSQVLLITDREFRAVGDFRRLEVDPATRESRYVSTGAVAPVVKGAGDGTMLIVNVPWKDTTEAAHPVKVGDLVVLADPDWPHASGQWLGHVDSIKPQPDAPMFARITVKPALNLAALREVQVMNKLPDDPAAAARTAQSVVDPKP
jgi:cell shape-determining protein MreC